jgi:hypothetical protein
MNDDSVAAPASPASSELPPLRIHHFLIWTALTAAILSGCMTFDRWARNGPPIENRVVIAGLVLAAVALAGAITVVGAGFHWRKRGIAFPRLPGEWLIVIVVTIFGLGFVAFALFIAIFLIFGDDDWFPAYATLVGLVQIAVRIGLNVIAIRRCPNAFAWQLTFAVLMMSPFAIGPTRLVSPITVAAIACVIWATCVEWYNGVQRGWTHWCGVACVVLLGISFICVAIV